MKYTLLSAVLFLWATLAQAGEIRGRVLNAQGEAVVGARVTVGNLVRRGQPKEENKQAITGPDGTYAITGLDPGQHTVVATAPSGNISLRRRVVIRSASHSLQVDLQLQGEPAPTTGP